VNALRTGNLDHALADDHAHDELAALRSVLAEATAALKTARVTKERLLADAAHELRTPLTVMRTSLDLALRRERTPEELKSALHDTRDEVMRLADLSSRLLDMVAAPHSREPFDDLDVRSLAAEAIDRARPAAQTRQLTIELEAGGPTRIDGQADALRRAIDNLLNNAIKHARSRITLSIAQDATHTSLRVHDDGSGIAENEREAVFEPFHRIAGSPAGAGLGLAIVREVARAHGGDARVEPDTEGCTLVIDLLRAHVDAART
jgi:signal transduction histidine kinase